MAASLAGGVYWWGSLLCIPFWFVYGVLYGSAMDSRWHECGHGTAFKTAWMNTAVYHVACFCMVRNPHGWRWSHVRHHTDTIIVGRDPEIAAMRPPKLLRLLSNFFGIMDAIDGWKRMLINASGKLDPQEATYIPKKQAHRVIRIARIWVLIYFAALSSAFMLTSWLPLMIIGLPRFFGAWHHMMTGILQHAGLAENVIDHRLNTRTVHINPISRFIYWNMNYHIEHHMFPGIPFHQLPALHQKIKHDLPEANSSMWQAWTAEVLPALMRQAKEPEYYLKRPLPSTASEYLHYS